MIRYQNHWAVVTGASSGLGRGLAGRLADRGMSLVLTGRNEVRLDEVAHQIVVRASVERVWEVLTDVERWPFWYRACVGSGSTPRLLASDECPSAGRPIRSSPEAPWSPAIDHRRSRSMRTPVGSTPIARSRCDRRRTDWARLWSATRLRSACSHDSAGGTSREGCGRPTRRCSRTSPVQSARRSSHPRHLSKG